jgi:DNA-binding protein H-NS
MAQRTKRFAELDRLALEELLDLRDRVEKLVDQRMVAEKLELRKKLARIEQYERRNPSMASEVPPRLAGITRRAVAPKYRDPSSGTTWSGRGKEPRWMTNLIKHGAKREDFRID